MTVDALVDALTDVSGLRVGHATRTGDGWLTGTTVVLAPEGGAVAAVDVRGGGPGTKETDALDPRNVVRKVEAVVLTGGSAYGLDSASGVMAWLEERGRGIRVGVDPAHVVPVVPAACVFDLGGAATSGPGRTRPPVALRSRRPPRASPAHRCQKGVWAPVRGGGRGGEGRRRQREHRARLGITVAALVVANAAGSVVDPETGVLYGELFQGRVEYPDAEVHEAARRRLAETAARSAPPPLNTTLAVVATDADLSKAQAQKLAGTAHDGIARAVRPVHLLNDGDTVFALATGDRALDTANPLALNEILAAGADVVTRAIVRAVRAAEPVDGPGGAWPSYGELYAGR
ncbi:P1 family peptidase [Streptomyces tuirus]|uniref:P1 family peptidase n=1 Tax=Streptomyces tuirus TaxID=68278 RepID=A0A941J0R0_9ACTN|nr:P1 family peptidase [Streptomyces tuirus]